MSMLFLGSLSLPNKASAVDFTIGGGLPFLVIPEISIASENNEQRWFANYKMGLDDGFSFGFEQGIDIENKHALGIFIGALGVKDDNRPCLQRTDKNDPLKELGCAIFSVFDEETTNGLGLSYSYNFSGLNHSGMRIRFELGYGEGADSQEKRVDGGFSFSYQF